MTDTDSLVRTVLLVVLVVVLLPVLLMAIAMPMMGLWGWGHMGGTWDGTGATWTWVVMWLLPLLVLLGIGYFLYATASRSGDGGRDAALEELRVAYARGDLTDEEFEQRRERLRREE